MFLPRRPSASLHIALITRITRAAMLDVLHQDYIRTARARGIGTQDPLRSRAEECVATRSSPWPASASPLLIGGAVVTETVFAIPGLGRLIVDAILRRDYPTIQAVVLLSSFVYVLVNLLIDLIYTLLDPRIDIDCALRKRPSPRRRHRATGCGHTPRRGWSAFGGHIRHYPLVGGGTCF